MQEPHDLIVYNRILAKVNSKTISVIDVMKKMDLFLQRYYPEHARSKYARYQYYMAQWRDTLAQMIDQELMLADAEHLELKVSDAEVREEVLSRFGPNIMATLDNMGMTYDEARALIYDEMVVQRMMWYRVHSKTLSMVNPQDIKEAYREYLAKNPPYTTWHYKILSIRSKDRETGAALAQKAFDLLQNRHTPLEDVSSQLKTDLENAHIALSAELEGDEKTLSTTYKEILQHLQPGAFSAPISQVSRTDNSVVFRIFFLKEQQKKEPIPFARMAEDLKDQLLQKAFTKENKQYISKLRERLSYDEKHMVETLPQDFHPFALKGGF